MHAAPYGTTATPAPGPSFGGGLRRIDFLLLVAAVGLIACSVYAIGTATEDDIEGSPLYYVIRQSIYGVVGIALMLVVARFDYSRLREAKLALYGLMLGSIVFVFLFGAAARGSRRWIDFPFFKFQPSELGKLLLVLALSAFVVDRARRLGERETPSRMMLLAPLPSMRVIAQPDLGSRLVYVVIALGILFFACTKWTCFAPLGALGSVAVVLVLVAAPSAWV